MSDKPQRPAWQTILISLVSTAVLVAIAYYVWRYANIGAGKYARGTLLTDLRFFVGMLAVFLILTFLDRIVEFLKSQIKSDQ